MDSDSLWRFPTFSPWRLKALPDCQPESSAID
jgi:hypothetical protein